MDSYFKKAWKIAKDELVGLPMAILTLVVVYGVIRAARQQNSVPQVKTLGDKIASWLQP